MKRILIVAGLVIAALGLTLFGATGAMVNAGAAGQPVLTVDATNATLVLPPQDGTQWGLFVFTIAADGSQTPAGNGSGGVGQIQLPLPKNYCGQVQIDYGKFDDSGNFHKDVGHKYTVATCETPTTTTTVGCPPNDTPPPCTVTTTTTPPSTTTTTKPDGPTSTAVPPPSSGGTLPQSVPSVPQGVSAPPLTPPVAVSPQLAFTGTNTKPIALVGGGLVSLGLMSELWTVRRRRALRLLTDQSRPDGWRA